MQFLKFFNFITIYTLFLSIFISSAALATQIIDQKMLRIAPNKKSGSGHTVLEQCSNAKKHGGWINATAKILIKQNIGTSQVDIQISDASPNTLYTAWLRISGKGPGNEKGQEVKIGPNPINGGGATALLPSTNLDEAILQSPPFEGTKNPKNGFATDSNGYAKFSIMLDFSLVGGVYPFHKASDRAVSELRNAGSKWPLIRKPAAIMNPSEKGISAPFMIRIVSHCQDGVAHGLSPNKREPWFQWKGPLTN